MVFNEIRIRGRKVRWVSIIWDYVNIFRYIIIVNLAIQNKFLCSKDNADGVFVIFLICATGFEIRLYLVGFLKGNFSDVKKN